MLNFFVCHQCHRIIRGEGNDNSQPCNFCKELSLIAQGLVAHYEKKYYPKIRIYTLALKYWLRGEDWLSAMIYAKIIVRGFKK